MRVAFHAPLKPPDHPDPSGDREMARLILKALSAAGAEPEIACRLRMFDRGGDTGLMQGLAEQAEREAAGYIERCLKSPQAQRPVAMVTYHVHYKAPDVFGRVVASSLQIPYVVIEGSRAPKRAGGKWAEGHRLAEQALDAADAILIMNPNDREMLETFAPLRQMLVDFPPFVDTQAWPNLAHRSGDITAPLRLLAVAMMRPGDKLASYRQLAEALALLPGDLAWTLDVVGDGPARPEVEALFSPLGDRVQFRGLVTDRVALAEFYAAADLLVWPAVNEAFGMVFLEAALQGCPSLAGRHGGVSGVIRAGLTGELVPPDQPSAFAQVIAALAGDEPRRKRLGRGARDFVRNERRVENAATILGDVLRKLATIERAAAWG